MGKGTTSFVSRRCRHGLEIKRLSGSGHFLFSFAGLCRYGGRFSAKTHFGAFYGLSTVVFSVKLRILRGPHSENNGFMLSEAVSQHGGKKQIPCAHFPRSAVVRCVVKMRGVSVAIWMMQAQRLSLFALLLRDDVGAVLRTGLYLQFDNAIQNMAYWLAVDQVAAGLRGVSVAEENALGREIAVIQTKFLLPRAAMTR